LRLAAYQGKVIDPGLTHPAVSFYGRTEKLHIHIEDRDSRPWQARDNINSLLCCVTITKDDSVIYQKFSRIGGLLSVLDMEGQLSLSAITTGHTLLEYFIEKGSENQDDNDTDMTDSEDGETMDSPDPSSNSGVALGYVNPANIASWTAMEPTKFIAFVKQAHKHHRQDYPSSVDNETTLSMTALRNGADFALLTSEPMNLWLSKSSPVTGQRNWYIDRQGSRITITDFKRYEHGTFSGPAYLIIRPDQEATEVNICPGESMMFVRGLKFRTQEIKTQQPLGMSKQELTQVIAEY
jgi:hypothetical protein